MRNNFVQLWWRLLPFTWKLTENSFKDFFSLPVEALDRTFPIVPSEDSAAEKTAPLERAHNVPPETDSEDPQSPNTLLEHKNLTDAPGLLAYVAAAGEVAQPSKQRVGGENAVVEPLIVSSGPLNVRAAEGRPEPLLDGDEEIASPQALLTGNRIIVQWRYNAPARVRQEALQAIGGKLLKPIRSNLMAQRDKGLLDVIQVAPGMSTEQAILAYQNRPGVEFVERDWVVGVQTVPNDPKYTDGTLWGMESSDTPINVGPAGTTNIYGSQAEQAWYQGHTGSTTIVIGVIDEGVDYTHRDLYLNIWLNPGEIPSSLRGNLQDIDNDGIITFRDLNDTSNSTYVDDVNQNGYIDAGDLLNDARWENGIDEDGNGFADDLIGWDFFNNDNNPYDGSGDDHGTHVAGTIGGIGNNGIGVSGVSQDVLMMSLKFLGSNGGYTSDAVAAVNYYADMTNRHDVDITGSTATGNYIGTSNSWGGGGFVQSLQEAIVTGGSVGNLFIAAAGNDASNNDSIARYPTGYSTSADLGWDAVISVASIASNGALSSFSNYGATTVDLGAPGSSIYSTLPGGTYGTYSGTSMATPHVSGAAAVLAAAFPSLSAEELRAALLSSATYTSSLDGKTATNGRLDLAAAIAAINPAGLDVSIVQTSSSVQLEGGGGTSTTFRFRIEVDEQPTDNVVVNYALRYGSANADDFSAPSTESVGSVILSAVQTWADVSFTVKDDSEIELDENFFVDITSAERVLNATAEGIILADDARIEGLVWNDLNQDGVYDTSSEQGLGGITVYLDANNNGFLDSGENVTETANDGAYSFNTNPGDYHIRLDFSNTPNRTQSYPYNFSGSLEPDNYSSGSILNSQLEPSVVVSAVGNSITNNSVYSQQQNFSSTGANVFASSWNGGLWNTGDAELRVDFSSPVNIVSIDAISDDSSDFAHLRAYDINGILIEEYITSDLGTGVSETMTISRPTNDISYFLASGLNGQFAWLDNLVYGSIDGNAPIQLTLGAETATGNNFGVFSPQATPVVSLQVIDGSPQVSEAGTQFTFDISLDTAPIGDVQILLDVVDQQGNPSDEAVIDRTSLVFDASNWQTPQKVIVTGADDLLVDGDQTFVVRTSAVSSSDPAYNGLTVDDITAINTDNDEIREVFFEAVSSELSINPDAVYEVGVSPVVVGDVAAVSSLDESGAVQSITEGVLINPAAYVASGETAVTGSVNGSYTDTRESDSVSQTITEVESGGKPSNRSTSLEHIWSFTNVNNATTLLIEADRSGAGDETYNLDWSTDGGVNWTAIGSDIVFSGTAIFSGLNLNGSGLLRVTTASAESGERNLDSLQVDRIVLEGPGSSSSGIDNYMLWKFSDLDSATQIYIEGWENDVVDDFQFEYSSDGGLNWNLIGVLSGGSSANPTVVDVTLSEVISAPEVLVRAFDTDRSDTDTSRGTLSVDKLYFKAEQTDLRTPVELNLNSGPATEEGLNPSVFRFVREAGGDTSNSLRVYFEFGGTAALSTDYTASGFSTNGEGTYVEIAANSTSTDIVITPIDDAAAEGSETVVLSLIEKYGYEYRIGVSGTTQTEIVDNDLQSYKPLSLTLEAGNVVQGTVTDLTTSDNQSQTLAEGESNGKPSSRYTYLTGVYDFGEVSNVASFTVEVDALTGLSSAESFTLEYSLDSGTSWISLIDEITGIGTYSQTFGTPLNTIGGNPLQVRVQDTDQTPGEQAVSSISLDQMAFSTETLSASGTLNLGTFSDDLIFLGQSDMIGGIG
ncbi:MAG: S8 family serine peptidase [Synechocystis sp.]|nr:S8 family serine peptidase [Synechocystis sp.]